MSIRKNMVVSVPRFEDRVSGELVNERPEGVSRYNVRAVEMWRDAGRDDIAKWEASPASKGMNCAGETKLPPRSIYAGDRQETEFKVVRSRVKARQGYYDVPKCALVEDSNGVRWYVKRAYIVA